MQARGNPGQSADLESRRGIAGVRLGFLDPIDAGRGWPVIEPFPEGFERVVFTGRQYLDTPIRQIPRPTGQPEFVRALARRRPEEHALYMAAHETMNRTLHR
jgi:hypothetical protein